MFVKKTRIEDFDAAFPDPIEAILGISVRARPWAPRLDNNVDISHVVPDPTFWLGEAAPA